MIDYVYFWQKTLTWAKEQAVLRGRPVPFRELIHHWRAYVHP